MATKVLFPFYRHITCNLQRQQFRTFLSAAYRCEEAWNKRLQHPLIQNIKTSEYLFELDQKYKKEGKVSAIDVDLIINKMEPAKEENLVREVEDLVHRLRRSPETIKTLPSTPHAVLRVLLEAGCTQSLMKILSDPLNYGVFPDYYTSNLLMDTFLEKKDYTAAARVASCNMLQEDFGPPLTQALTLASCYLYISSDQNPPWEDCTPKMEEPEEEVKVCVRYLRNPYFDDHFDLKDPNHIVGKTLAWVSPLISGMVGVNCQILGWALYNKWAELEAALHHASKGTESVAASVISRVKEIVGACDDNEAREKVLSAISQLEASGSKVAEHDLGSLIVDIVQKAAADSEKELVKSQEDTYTCWEKAREEEFQHQLDKYRKQNLLAEIERKKKDLAEKEEVIYFFDNRKKLEMLLPDRKRKYYPKKKSLIYKKKQPRKVDEGYIPPEVIQR